MKWMYFLVICVTLTKEIRARPGPNEFTHKNAINETEATSTDNPDIQSPFTKEDESILRRYLQQLNYSLPKNVDEDDGSNNNILNNFLKTSIDDLKQNRFTSIHSTIDPDSEPSKSYNVGIPNRYYEYEINEPGYVNVPINPRPQTAIFTNIKPVFELETINPHPNGYYGGAVRPTFVTTPTEATLISPLFHNSPTKVTKYHLITPKPAFNIRPTHKPYVSVYGYEPYDPSDPDPNYDDDYNQIDSLNFNSGYDPQPFNVKNKKKKKKKCKEPVTNQLDPDCENVKLTVSQNIETITPGHVIKIPNKGTSTHNNKLDLSTFDEKQKDPGCNGGCCDGSCAQPYPPVPIPNPPLYPPLNPILPLPPRPLPSNIRPPLPTPNAIPLLPQQVAPVSQTSTQTRPILSALPGAVIQSIPALVTSLKPNKEKEPYDDDGFDFDFDIFDIGSMKFGSKKILKKLWPIVPYLFALNPLSLGFWTVVLSPALLIIAGATVFALFLYPWAQKAILLKHNPSTVVVHKHPGKRPPAPWHRSPNHGNAVRWTIKPKSKPSHSRITQRKKRFTNDYKYYDRDEHYGTQNTISGTNVETIAQTESKIESEIPVKTPPQPSDSKIITSGSLLMNEKRHLGVAVPLTMDEVEREMASHSTDRDTSTSKDGISTWILLSGTNPTTSPDTSMMDSKSGNENQKVDKIVKVRDNSKAPVKATSKPLPQNNKSKTKPKATTPMPAADNIESEKLPEPMPIAQTPILRPKKKATTTTTTTTTTQQPLEEDVTELIEENIITTKEPPVPFLVLEPKDADFDLPQDRSPGKPTTKKPKRNNNKNKKKTNKPVKATEIDDIKNSTKTAIKKKENPLGTKIYNYLSREVMPMAGVGLLGLVVTAGLAGYFLGPLGALRRSYDVADRKDDLYYYNNEEYAGTDGQSEEEVFGKVIAGMPLNTNYRNNVRQPVQRPNYFHQNPSKYHQQYNNRYRNTASNQFHQQHPAQQLSYSNYHPNTQSHAPNYQRIHHVASANQNVVSQKSISNPIFAIPQPSATTTKLSSTASTLPPTTVVHDINELSSKDSDVKSTDFMEDNPNELRKRTQFVVGSVLPDTNVMDMNDNQGTTALVPEHGPRKRRSVSVVSNRKSIDSVVKNLEESYENLRKRIEPLDKDDSIAKEMKHIDYEMTRLRKVIAEIRDIEQFQDELHIKRKNSILHETVSNGVVHISGDIKFVNELLDNPTEIESKIANRAAMTRTVNGEKPLNATLQNKSDQMATETFEPTEPPSGIMSLLKILELKAAFGVNVLRSIRPAFDRAFADVFHSPNNTPEST